MTSRLQFPMPHLLIVEDNPDDVELLSVALTPYQHRLSLSWVPNMTTALQYLRKQDPFQLAQTPDLIVVDLNLPTHSGRMLLHELSQDPVGRHSRRLVLSGTRTATDVEYAQKYGVEVSVLKPVLWDGWVDLAHQVASLAGCTRPESSPTKQQTTRQAGGVPSPGFDDVSHRRSRATGPGTAERPVPARRLNT
jgi:CheY-like chemotaxis protein